MKTVYKYPIILQDKQTLDLPKGAEILSFQEQDGLMYIWVFVDTAAPLESRVFYVLATGEEIDTIFNLEYIGTAQDSPFVWHLFEQRSI